MITRLPNWQDLLDKFIQGNSHRSFQWGEWDCGNFTAGAVLAITGIDMEKHWHDRHSCPRAVSLLGGAEQVAITTAIQWDLSECAPQLAGRGDLVLLSNPPLEPCLGIIDLKGDPLKVTDDGIVSVDRRLILRGWHI